MKRGFQKKKSKKIDWRMRALRFLFIGFTVIIALRLFNLQIVNAGFYNQLASGQHAFYKELFASRGNIMVKDWKSEVEYFAATNEPRAFIFADPRKIEDPQAAAIAVGKLLGYEMPEDVEVQEEEEEEVKDILEGVHEESEEVVEEFEVVEVTEDQEEVEDDDEEKPNEILILIERFSKEDDPYEPVARNVEESILNKIMDLEIEGISYVMEDSRAYPEVNLGGHIFGFVGINNEGAKVGNYGIEGYFNDYLAGENGFLDTQTDISGRWIGVGSRNFKPAKDGGEVLLTIDRTIQYVACQALLDGVEAYEADGGSLIIIEPKTGRVMAMCNAPDFDPNTYSNVENVSIYNNKAIYEAYEPGSVFKPIVMAAALDQGAVTPSTLFNDTGEVEIDEYTIRNSDLKAHGIVDMTGILEQSLNTGMINVMRLLGGQIMTSYIEDFGFGTITGIELNTESSGTLASLYKDSEIYYATASYGQGITVTPIQIAMAYTAIANGGELMKPFIVQELRHDDGTVEETLPASVGQVISKKTATTIGAMLVSVIENGHAELASVDGYYIAGKTGTAQVAKQGSIGYEEGVTKATFAGFGPVEDPEFVMVVLVDHPRTAPWAADTAAPIFGEVADFLMQYLEVAPRRSVE